MNEQEQKALKMLEEIEIAAKPLIEYMKKKHSPTKEMIIIDGNQVKVLGLTASIPYLQKAKQDD